MLNIRAIRKAYGLTQGQLAQLLQVHAVTAHRYENGLQDPGPRESMVLTILWNKRRQAAPMNIPARLLTQGPIWVIGKIYTL